MLRVSRPESEEERSSSEERVSVLRLPTVPDSSRAATSSLKYSPERTVIMDDRIVITAALVLALLLAGTGCLSPDQPPATPVPTPVPATEPAPALIPVPATTASTEPGPVDTLPPGWDLSVTVEKGGMYSRTIIARFDGGKGLMYATRMDVRVTYPDGTVLTDGITRPMMGDSVEIPGSTGTDRVEVIMLMASGDTYTIIDRQMPYRNKD